MARTDTETLVVQLESRINQFERSFQRANRTASHNWSQIENRGRMASRRIEADMARVGRAVTRAFGAFGIGVGAGALARQVRSIVSEVSELGKQARTVGMAAEEFQALRHGMGLAGVEAGQFGRAMEAFTQRIGQAADQGNQLGRVLEANGVSIRDQNGQIRGTLDLLRDFADLMQRAQSEQEAMNLATMAFGDRAGRRMVLALREGRLGMDEMSRAAHEAGVVLGNDLFDAAERVDDKFATLTAQIGTKFKTAVLTAVDHVSMLATKLGELEAAASRFGNSPFWQRLRDALGVEGGPFKVVPGQGIVPATEAARAELIRKLQAGELDNAPFGLEAFQPPSSRPPLVGIGGGSSATAGGSRGRAAIATREQRDAVEELIKSLEQELSLVKASDVERAVANNLRQAGAEATEAQRQRIVQLTEALITEEEAAQRAGEATRLVGDIGADAFRSLAAEIRTGNDLLDRMIAKLAEAAAQAIFFGSGPFAGLFGGGGGLLGSIGGKAATPGLFASGGMVRGPGTGQSDSIPARLSNGEFVVNARATAQHRQLLEAINSNRLPRFSRGGAVNAPASTTGGLSVKIEVKDRAGVSIEQAGPARRENGETVIPVMIRRLKEEMAGDVANNGPLARSIERTFGLSRKART